jgi:putative ABC transport system ATP-binding protein
VPPIPPRGLPPLYRVEGASKVYAMGDVEVPALLGVDLEVREGEILAILGPSGSGKSTLLHLLGGMDRPTRGRVWFRDMELTALSPADLTLFRRRHVGFVFQFFNLIPSLTALENVAMATEIAPQPRDPRAMIERVGLGPRADHFPAQLSGGEQQRVAIARAVAKAPDVLLCDEPTGALDARTGVLVLGVLRQVNLELGTTLILVTHNVAIGGMCDRVLRMGSGRVVEVTENARPKAPAEIAW